MKTLITKNHCAHIPPKHIPSKDNMLKLSQRDLPRYPNIPAPSPYLEIALTLNPFNTTQEKTRHLVWKYLRILYLI